MDPHTKVRVTKAEEEEKKEEDEEEEEEEVRIWGVHGMRKRLRWRWVLKYT